jgi:hypothetical protein
MHATVQVSKLLTSGDMYVDHYTSDVIMLIGKHVLHSGVRTYMVITGKRGVSYITRVLFEQRYVTQTYLKLR